MRDERLFSLPSAEGVKLNRLDCRGDEGKHDSQGYRCANYGIPGCLKFVCLSCARKQQAKPWTEVCGMCALAEEHGSSMSAALAFVDASKKANVKGGKIVCASTLKGEPKCKRCIQKTCGHCQNIFWTHKNREAHCSDICRAAKKREWNRLSQERKKALKTAS
jgi:hypothetical protein